VRPGGMRFDTHQPATPDVKNFVQVDKHFRLFWDILFRWGGIIERQVGRLFLVCHWARHPHLLHHRYCTAPIRNAEYFDTDVMWDNVKIDADGPINIRKSSSGGVPSGCDGRKLIDCWNCCAAASEPIVSN
jgi:hypothetical protein